MDTIKINLSGLPESEYIEALDKAAEIIKSGGTVVFPTETVYGLGADGTDEKAVKKIFEAKGRPGDNPLILHVADFNLMGAAEYIPSDAEKLMERFWPGPLTIILKKEAHIPNATTGGLSTVGIRMPKNRAAQDLIKLSGVPIAAPSANISGRPSPTTFERCVKDLDGRVDMILGWDLSEVGIESTIIDLSGEKPEVLRPGGVTLEELKETIGDVIYKSPGELKDGEVPKAPGMKYTHYSPEAKVIVIKGSEKARGKFLTSELFNNKETCAIIFTPSVIIEGEREMPPGKVMRFDGPREAAHGIFEALRLADDRGYEVIYVEELPGEGIGLAVMNRIDRAAGFSSLEVRE